MRGCWSRSCTTRERLLSTCQDGDGCCPDGCTSTNDHECACLDNLALQATAASSGGGTGGMGPAKMNDGVGEESCPNHWIYNDPNSVDTWIQLDFPQDLLIASLYVATENATNPGCAGLPGRNIADGQVQVWDGANWNTVASFSGETDDVQVDSPHHHQGAAHLRRHVRSGQHQLDDLRVVCLRRPRL